jgi:hypothetical protein
MINWYTRITADLSLLPDFIDNYRTELQTSKREIKITGSVMQNISQLPAITDLRFHQLQEIEAVLNYLNIRLRSLRRKYFQKYLEGYNRALTSRDAEKYVDGEGEVIDFEILINEVALLRNEYLSTMKGLESKNFMLGHLVRLKTAGMEDFTI